jgi:hypothetical protein
MPDSSSLFLTPKCYLSNALAGYGEKGVIIISQILFDLFPSIPGSKVQPFDADFSARMFLF